MNKKSGLLVVGVSLAAFVAHAGSLEDINGSVAVGLTKEQLSEGLVNELNGLESDEMANLYELLLKNKQQKQFQNGNLFEQLKKAGVIDIKASSSSARTGSRCITTGE